MAADSVVVVQQAPGGDRPIDNSAVPNSAAPGGVAHRQRTEAYGGRFDRVIHRAELVLPASGAFSDQAAFVLPDGITRVTYVIRYTKGGAGGFPRFRPRWGDGTDEAAETVLRATLATLGHLGRQALFLQELDGPVPPNGGPLVYALPFEVPAGMVNGRLLVAEAGNTASPGTCRITLVGGTA